MTSGELVSPTDSLERQNQKLGQIIDVLMRRVEASDDDGGAAYALFQRAAMLEDQVRERTRDLERALDLLNRSNAELEEANRTAERARSDLAGAIETIQEGFAIFDPQDRLTLCNSRFGMHMPDILGRLVPGLPFDTYVTIVSESRHLRLDPGDSPAAWAARRRGHHRQEHAIFNVQVAGDRWLQVSEQRMPQGQTVIMQTDISHVIRMEREERGRILDDQARLVRATLDHLIQGICIFDRDARLVGFNQRAASLLALPRLTAGLEFDLILAWLQSSMDFGGADPRAIRKWVARTDARPPVRLELRRGVAQTLDVFAQEMPDRGFVISFTDMTVEREAARALAEANERLEQRVTERTVELRQALAAAERANTARTRFVAAASHDLLQPLSAATLFVTSVQDDLRDPRHEEALTKAERSLRSVEDIIKALLDISKLESGQASVTVAEVDVGEILAQLAGEFGPLARQKGLTLRVRPCRCRVVTDPRYIRRILQNLIGNAIRYTDRGGVVVGARRVRRSVRLEIWDTGRGIPESEFENVFLEFHRLDARSSASEGLGLGLAIVQRACALLNHPVEIASRVGRGTRFRVTVPQAAPRAGEPALPARTRREPVQAFPGMVALLVENDRDMRQALCLLLERWDIEVIDVGSGQEALDLIDETQLTPDVVLVDFQLDGGELGTDLIPGLFARTGRIPACIITANRSAQIGPMAADLGGALLHKPLDPAALQQFLALAARA